MRNVNEEIKIDTEYITLGQFLKLADVIQSGGMAKWFLSEHDVLSMVNKISEEEGSFVPETRYRFLVLASSA